MDLQDTPAIIDDSKIIVHIATRCFWVVYFHDLKAMVKQRHTLKLISLVTMENYRCSSLWKPCGSQNLSPVFADSSQVCWLKRNIFFSVLLVHCGSVVFNPCYSWWNLPFTELDDGKNYINLQGTPKPIFDDKKTLVSCRFSLKQIHWPVVSQTPSKAGPGPVGPRSQGSRHSTCSAQDDGVQRLCVGDDGRNAWTVMDDWQCDRLFFLVFSVDGHPWSVHMIIPTIIIPTNYI
jgi:hypothetical protein